MKACMAPLALAQKKEAGPVSSSPRAPGTGGRTRNWTSVPREGPLSCQVRNSRCSGMSQSVTAGEPPASAPPKMAHPSKSVRKQRALPRLPPPARVSTQSLKLSQPLRRSQSLSSPASSRAMARCSCLCSAQATAAPPSSLSMTGWLLRRSHAISWPSSAPASMRLLPAATQVMGCWTSSKVASLFKEEGVTIHDLTDWSREPDTRALRQGFNPKQVTVSACTWHLASAEPHDEEYSATALSCPPIARRSVFRTASAQRGIGETRKFLRKTEGGVVSPSGPSGPH
mmetsp:Transcript_91492/g.273008  ORF Transcript_91492/g.273008 Transcript_91492/m.273008 type:complete len:285 (-) Transcript_91492:1803-2657(-)